jgi:FtsP/CotA-like multicopper oxidase with cupredoxin domain
VFQGKEGNNTDPKFQAWEGAAGGIIINGPASANYDVDLGSVMLTDWNHWTADMLYASSQTNGPVVELTGLINGKNKWNTSISSEPTSGGPPPGAPPPSKKRQVASNSTVSATSSNSSELIGEYYELKFEKGLSYRLRLVNVAVDSGFKYVHGRFRAFHRCGADRTADSRSMATP